MSQQPMRLGLTGGIGSGKSTVARIFSALDAIVIDADAISHSLTTPHGAAINAIKSQFGESMISADGSLNRSNMRALIFADHVERKRLESIIHPLVKREMQRQDEAAVAFGARLIVYDIPLLIESPHWRSLLDQVLVVDCLEQTQIKRVMARSALKQVVVEKIIASQSSRKIRNSAADILIFNDSITVEQLGEQVTQVAQHFKCPFDERKKL
jgi:dephospho-CoA kinase